jgi:hypothetical protein
LRDTTTSLERRGAQQVVQKLLDLRLIEAVRARGDVPIWRREDDGCAMALRLTSRGLERIQALRGEVGPKEQARVLEQQVGAKTEEKVSSDRGRPRRNVAAAGPMIDGSEQEDEITPLRDLDLPALRARWRTVFRRKAPEPLPRHLLFRILAYRLQADRPGDLDQETARLLDRIASGNGGHGLSSVLGHRSRFSRLQPGSTLVREWGGARHRIEVLDKGFA